MESQQNIYILNKELLAQCDANFCAPGKMVICIHSSVLMIECGDSLDNEVYIWGAQAVEMSD